MPKKTIDIVYTIPGEKPVITDALVSARQDLEQYFLHVAPTIETVARNNAAVSEAHSDMQQAGGMTELQLAAWYGHDLQNKRTARARL